MTVDNVRLQSFLSEVKELENVGLLSEKTAQIIRSEIAAKVKNLTIRKQINEILSAEEIQELDDGKSLAILQCLYEHEEQVVQYHDLVRVGWPDRQVLVGVLAPHIKKIRKITSRCFIIETVPKKGYKLTVKQNESST